MRKATILLALSAMVVGLASCDKKKDDKLTIGGIPKCTSGEFWITVQRGAKDAAKALDVELKWQGTQAEHETTKQIQILDNIVNLEVDGIALAPLNETALEGPVADAVAKGIPVVIFDSGIKGNKHTSVVATDNTAGGKLAAKEMIRLLGEGKGNVIVLRYQQGSASTEKRSNGFIEDAEAAGIKVLESPHPTGSGTTDCQRTAESVLAKYVKDGKLDLDGVFACNLYSAVGMLNALDGLRDSGTKVDHVKFIGFDSDKNLVDALKADRIDALVVQDPYRMGYLAVETIVKVLRKEKVPDFVDTGAKLVTTEALAKDPELRKLVGLK